MELRYHINSETKLPHIYDHDIDEEEVEEVLEHPGRKYKGAGNSAIVEGRTDAGRYMRVIYVPDPGASSVFVITAYELSGKDKAAYLRYLRKHPYRRPTQ